ncbi:hypothetical protein AV530_011719 [Patagioenas fasciata monilis]|uniref:Uncharacterized protein n=1 Tax=Patagioenas fasciata monilis TaxID=372326 RepID=A0A1V4KLI6_PATFA|nr:hypothetical protein AV530_011719 [Patagioenas fasciata monilis]
MSRCCLMQAMLQRANGQTDGLREITQPKETPGIPASTIPFQNARLPLKSLEFSTSALGRPPTIAIPCLQSRRWQEQSHAYVADVQLRGL